MGENNTNADKLRAGFGQPDGLLGPTEAERAAAATHDDEIARVRAMATDPGVVALAGAWKDGQ